MRSTLLRSCLLWGLLLNFGCISPLNTRLPTVESRHPELEKRSYERHDPFADRLKGPDTQTRPRGFDIQRTEPRRALEDRMLQGSPLENEPPAPRLPRTGWRYPNVVQP